jgi:REP element-mobilizing transposase RayT
MLDDYGFEIYEENAFPLAYLITIRTYGTWLHGDKRFSINRSNRHTPAMVKLDPNVPLEETMQDEMNHPPVRLGIEQRKVVHEAIVALCQKRTYLLYCLNVLTNHAHVVVGAKVKPERIADSFKAVSTRSLRELGLVASNERIWSRGRSRRYLWKPRHLDAAIDYVLHCQGNVPFDDWNQKG